MKKLIKHIRSQPKSKIDSYAFMVAGTFTGIVALIWAFSLPQKMERVSGSDEANSPAPFSNLLKETGEQLAAVKNGIKSKEPEEEAATTSEGIILSEEEITKAKEAIATNASTNNEATTTVEAVPVLIATTSATTTHAASSTP